MSRILEPTYKRNYNSTSITCNDAYTPALLDPQSTLVFPPSSIPPVASTTVHSIRPSIDPHPSPHLHFSTAVRVLRGSAFLVHLSVGRFLSFPDITASANPWIFFFPRKGCRSAQWVSLGCGGSCLV